MFKCSRCLKIFKRKFNYERHMLKKNLCKETTVTNMTRFNGVKNEEKTEFKCHKCETAFSTKGNLKRHMDNPTTACTMLNKMETILGNANLGNTTNNINTTNIVNQIVQFVKPGKEKIGHITKEKILEIMKADDFRDVCKDLMKLMYFNRQVPENSGWCIIYPKNENAAMILNHNTQKFERKKTTEIIDEKFANMMDLITPIMNEIYDDPEIRKNLSINQRRNIGQFYHHFGMEDISKNSPMVYESIREMSYDIKQIPMDAWKDEGLSGKHLSIKF